MDGEAPLQGLLDPRFVFSDLKGPGMEDVLAEMARRLAAAGVVRDVSDLTHRLIEREKLGCTGLGSGVAIPHCKSKDVQDIVLAIGLAPQGVDFHAPDGRPVTLIFLILSPADQPAAHLQTLARISRLLRTPGISDNLRRAATREELLEALKGPQGTLTAARS
jgi:fructose-specific phosphotransferase system IIA component